MNIVTQPPKTKKQGILNLHKMITVKLGTELLTSQQKHVFCQKIKVFVQNIKNKLDNINERQTDKKQNKKLLHNSWYFQHHLQKLTQIHDWLHSPIRKFQKTQMQKLTLFLRGIMVSQDDKIFQQQIGQLYQSIFDFAAADQSLLIQSLISSFNNQPKMNDYLPTYQVKQKNNGVGYHYALPKYMMIDLSVIPKMSNEVLFFIFFSQQGKCQQYLVARELLKRLWKYYTRFHFWIKRTNYATFDQKQGQETGNYVTIGADLIMRERKDIKIKHKFLITKL